MKLVMSLMIAFFSLAASNASANMKPRGYVKSSSCADQIETKSLSSRGTHRATEVCFASIVGLAGSYITVDSAIWKVVNSSPDSGTLLHIGWIDDRGLMESTVSTRPMTGEFVNINGTLVIKTTTAQYTAKSFKIMYSTL